MCRFITRAFLSLFFTIFFVQFILFNSRRMERRCARVPPCCTCVIFIYRFIYSKTSSVTEKHANALGASLGDHSLTPNNGCMFTHSGCIQEEVACSNTCSSISSRYLDAPTLDDGLKTVPPNRVRHISGATTSLLLLLNRPI